MTIHTTPIKDTGIDFLSAVNGGLELSNSGRSTVFWSKSVSDIVEFVREVGLADHVYASSTMDFASEEGFADDDGANEMWTQVVEAL
jgi:hypothetical protein